MAPVPYQGPPSQRLEDLLRRRAAVASVRNSDEAGRAVAASQLLALDDLIADEQDRLLRLGPPPQATPSSSLPAPSLLPVLALVVPAAALAAVLAVLSAQLEWWSSRGEASSSKGAPGTNPTGIPDPMVTTASSLMPSGGRVAVPGQLSGRGNSVVRVDGGGRPLILALRLEEAGRVGLGTFNDVVTNSILKEFDCSSACDREVTSELRSDVGARIETTGAWVLTVTFPTSVASTTVPRTTSSSARSTTTTGTSRVDSTERYVVAIASRRTDDRAGADKVADEARRNGYDDVEVLDRTAYASLCPNGDSTWIVSVGRYPTKAAARSAAATVTTDFPGAYPLLVSTSARPETPCP